MQFSDEKDSKTLVMMMIMLRTLVNASKNNHAGNKSAYNEGEKEKDITTLWGPMIVPVQERM